MSPATVGAHARDTRDGSAERAFRVAGTAFKLLGGCELTGRVPAIYRKPQGRNAVGDRSLAG